MQQPEEEEICVNEENQHNLGVTIAAVTCSWSHCVLCTSLLFSSSMAFLLTEDRSFPIRPLITTMNVSVGNSEFTWITQGSGETGTLTTRVNRHDWPHLVQNIVGFVQQNSPELGGGFVGILLHRSSNAVNVPEQVLQQPEEHMKVTSR